MLVEKLSDHRVLIVEDEYMLASDMAGEFKEAGATVLGPVGTLKDAVAAIEGDEQIDVVILDVNLRGESAYPAADLLLARGVPFVFATGYDEAAVLARFSQVVRCEKPTDMKRMTHAIASVIRS